MKTILLTAQMKSILLTALLLAPLATLQSSEPRLKPGLPAPLLKISGWTEPRLKPGDLAPKLITTEWTQGGPVTAFDKDKVYLVEFFATPLWTCDDNIPHFNALYQKFKDKGLVVIGVNVNAKLAVGDSTDIKSLVGKKANTRIYPVAVDRANKPQGTMMDAWMGAAGQTCLPCAFLVGKDGKIAWIGNPAELTEAKIAYPAWLDERIEELLAGNFDISKAASEFMAEQKLERKQHLRDAAEGLLQDESLSGQALDDAYEMAVKANEGYLRNDAQRASHLAVLARATFMKGEKAKAVELQEKVIALMADTKPDEYDADFKAEQKSILANYKAGHLPAMPPRAAVITLKRGDAAPKLNCGEWIQGKPVSEFAKDKAYLIEFWATWCVPCVAEIPHLNALHLKFKEKGLVVIGQNVEGKDQRPVKAFVKKMGDRMTYPVALDQMSGSGQSSMVKMWLEAAGLNSIPSAFLVGKDGRLVWMGHPNELKETMIEEALADKADRSKTPIADPTSAGPTTEKK